MADCCAVIIIHSITGRLTNEIGGIEVVIGVADSTIEVHRQVDMARMGARRGTDTMTIVTGDISIAGVDMLCMLP